MSEENTTTTMKPNAVWKNDCLGKKDFDAPIVVLSSRYWPRGGGYFVVHKNPATGARIEGNESRPELKPSAKSSIYIVASNDEICSPNCPDYYVLIEKEFEAETEAEVKEQVEQWAQAQMQRVVEAMKREFGKQALSKS